MTSLHELRELPNEGDYFLSFDDLLEVIRDASIKYKSLLSISLTLRSSLSPNATLPWLEFLVAGQRKRDLWKTRYEGLGERLPHKLWQSLQEMATTRYGLRITALRVEREGTFLWPVRDLTIRGGGDDEVRIVILSGDSEVRGHYSYLCYIILYNGIWFFFFNCYGI
jgi:hypothetical protein